MKTKMTQADFETYLEAEVAKLSAGQLLAIPGVHEALSEELNNAVIEAWEKDNPLPSIDDQLSGLVPQWEELIRKLIPTIEDDYRASEDPDDDTPAMCLTIGFTPETREKDCSWGWQTGDNSFTGGAYCHPHWAVVTVGRDSHPGKLAKEVESELADLAGQ